MYCTIGTAGHVDHGKTSLVKALTGVDTDRLKEERERGLSIELGFAHMNFFHASDAGNHEPLKLSFVDVPGHERFISTMLAGTTGIDAVLFVVAADDGPMPQTLEHLDIVNLLGVDRAVFAITKCDAVSNERVGEVKEALLSLLMGTVLEDASIVALSSKTGEGMELLKDALRSVCRLVPRVGSETLPKGGPYFRLPVDRAFAIKGFGAVVTGTVASGSLSVGEEIAIFPPVKGLATLVARGLESRHEKVDEIRTGERGAINLRGVSHTQLKRGQMLAYPALLKSTSGDGLTAVDSHFTFSKRMEGELKDGARIKLHHLSGSTLATLRFKDKKRAKAGERVYGRLLLHQPMLMMRSDRFVIRETALGRVVGGGKVLMSGLASGLYSTGASRMKVKEVDYETLDTGTTPEIITSLLREKDLAIDSTLLPYILNITEEEFSGSLSGFERVGRFVAPSTRLDLFKKKFLNLVEGFHIKNPSEAGIDETRLVGALREGFSFNEEFFSLFTAGLSEEGRIKADGTTLSLKNHSSGLTGKELEIEAAIRALFGDGIRVLSKDDLFSLSFPKAEIATVVDFLKRDGALVRLRGERFISKAALLSAREKLVDEVKARGKVKATDFRDALGCGRKLAIEILEYFDGAHVTLRQGDYRTLR